MRGRAGVPSGWRGRLRGWLGRLATGLSGCDFEIRCAPGSRTEVRGRVAAAKVAEIVEFIDRDLRPSSAAVIRGSWDARGSLRLRFTGGLPAGSRQRARNFLLERLR